MHSWNPQLWVIWNGIASWLRSQELPSLFGSTRTKEHLPPHPASFPLAKPEVQSHQILLCLSRGPNNWKTTDKGGSNHQPVIQTCMLHKISCLLHFLSTCISAQSRSSKEHWFYSIHHHGNRCCLGQHDIWDSINQNKNLPTLYTLNIQCKIPFLFGLH